MKWWVSQLSKSQKTVNNFKTMKDVAKIRPPICTENFWNLLTVKGQMPLLAFLRNLKSTVNPKSLSKVRSIWLLLLPIYCKVDRKKFSNGVSDSLDQFIFGFWFPAYFMSKANGVLHSNCVLLLCLVAYIHTYIIGNS